MASIYKPTYTKTDPHWHAVGSVASHMSVDARLHSSSISGDLPAAFVVRQ